MRLYIVFLLLFISHTTFASLFRDDDLIIQVNRLDAAFKDIKQELQAIRFALEKDHNILIKQAEDKRSRDIGWEKQIKTIEKYIADLKKAYALVQIESHTYVEKYQADIDIVRSRLKLIEDHIKELTHKVNKINSSIEEKQNIVPADIKLFEEGIKAFKAEKWSLSQRIFQALVSAYPISIHWVDSLYWLGMTYFLQKDYVSARMHFISIAENYPENKKASLSLFQVVLCDQSLQHEETQQDINRLLTGYPQSTSAYKAKALGWTMKESAPLASS